MRRSQFGTDGVAVLDPPGSVNLYRYCGNDPINRADPSGLIDFSIETADFVSRMPAGVWEQFVRRHGLPAVARLNQAHADDWRFEFRAELWNAYEVDRSTRTVSIDLDNGVFFDAPASPREMADAINAVLNAREEDDRLVLRPPATRRDTATPGDFATAWDENVTQHEALAMASAKSLDFLYNVRNDLALAAVGGVFGRFMKTDDLIDAGNRARVTRKAAEGQLVHLTDDAGAFGIVRTGTIRGSHGIYAVPAHVATESTALKVLRTGLSPGKTKNAVPIPDEALSLFNRPVPVGPYSGWKYFGGVRYADPGSISTTTGALTRSSSLFGPKVLIYGPDGVFYVGIATEAGLYIYGQTE
ncbi:MAG: hypothetical protein WBC44_10910 [Planctomycetaceae bacterium]